MVEYTTAYLCCLSADLAALPLYGVIAEAHRFFIMAAFTAAAHRHIFSLSICALTAPQFIASSWALRLHYR